jgi:hypothetical protein
MTVNNTNTGDTKMISTATLNAAIENAASLKTQTVAFEVGKTYMTRSIGDHNCIIKITVASRTKCFITLTEEICGNGKRFKVSDRYSPGEETCRPWGSYSMAPIVGANDTKELKKDWE